MLSYFIHFFTQSADEPLNNVDRQVLWVLWSRRGEWENVYQQLKIPGLVRALSLMHYLHSVAVDISYPRLFKVKLGLCLSEHKAIKCIISSFNSPFVQSIFQTLDISQTLSSVLERGPFFILSAFQVATNVLTIIDEVDCTTAADCRSQSYQAVNGVVNTACVV